MQGRFRITAMLLAIGLVSTILSETAAAAATYSYEGPALTKQATVGMAPVLSIGGKISGQFEFDQPLISLSSAVIDVRDPRLLHFDFSYGSEHWSSDNGALTGSIRLSTDAFGNPTLWNFGLNKPSSTDPKFVYNISVAGGPGEGPYNYVTYADTTSPAADTVYEYSPGTLTLDQGMLSQFIYVANEVSDNVSAYVISPDGSPTPIGAPVAAGDEPLSLVVDPTGRFVYVANHSSSNVTAYSIGADGLLKLIAQIPVGPEPDALGVDPTGRFLYVGTLGDGSISAYSIGSTGALTPIGSPVATGGSPGSIAVDPTGEFVYVVNYLGDEGVAAFRIGPTGTLTPIGLPIDSGGFFPVSLKVDPTGRFVYVANYSSDNVSAFKVRRPPAKPEA